MADRAAGRCSPPRHSAPKTPPLPRQQWAEKPHEGRVLHPWLRARCQCHPAEGATLQHRQPPIDHAVGRRFGEQTAGARALAAGELTAAAAVAVQTGSDRPTLEGCRADRPQKWLLWWPLTLRLMTRAAAVFLFAPWPPRRLMATPRTGTARAPSGIRCVPIESGKPTHLRVQAVPTAGRPPVRPWRWR